MKWVGLTMSDRLDGVVPRLVELLNVRRGDALVSQALEVLVGDINGLAGEEVGGKFGLAGRSWGAGRACS